MKRRIQGLRETTPSGDNVAEGVYLVRVDRAQYRWHKQKPYYLLRLSVLEPSELAGRVICGRLYCTSQALWKLGWFLLIAGWGSAILITGMDLWGLPDSLKGAWHVIIGG